MASRESASPLRVRAATLARRVQRLGLQPHHPFTGAEIAAIGLEVSNLGTLLTVGREAPDGVPDLAHVAQRLDGVARRLDAIEELLRVRSHLGL